MKTIINKIPRRAPVEKTLILFAFVASFAVHTLLHAETITFQADKMSGYSGNVTDYTVLSGNAKIKTNKIEISAESIELSGEDFRFISATGKVKGRNFEQDMDFACETLRYDRETEVVSLKSNADIFDHPNEVTAKAQIIEYNQKTNIATMQISVELKQKDSVCTSAYAIYRKDQQILEMSGNPNVKKKEDVFRAREIVFNLDTEEITLDGRVRGAVKTNGEDDSGAAPAIPPAEAVPVSAPSSPPPDAVPASTDAGGSVPAAAEEAAASAGDASVAETGTVDAGATEETAAFEETNAASRSSRKKAVKKSSVR